MAADNKSLTQALIDGGITPAASRVIANALANASTPQFSQTRDVSDATPRDQLRMIDANTRKYLLTNLDYSPEAPYQSRLAAHPGRFAGDPADHPYKGSQPVAPVPPLSQPSVQAGDYIGVDNSVQEGTPVSTVSLKLSARDGAHLRLNSATKSIDAVPLEFESPQGLVTATTRERKASSTVELIVRKLEEKEVLLADGTTYGVHAWPDASVTPSTVFSSGTWTPAYIGVSGGSSGTIVYAAATGGRYVRFMNMVMITGVINTTSRTGGSGTIAIGGLPFAAAQNSSFAVGFKGGFLTSGPVIVWADAGAGFALMGDAISTGLTGILTAANIPTSTNTFLYFSGVYPITP